MPSSLHCMPLPSGLHSTPGRLLSRGWMGVPLCYFGFGNTRFYQGGHGLVLRPSPPDLNAHLAFSLPLLGSGEGLPK